MPLIPTQVATTRQVRAPVIGHKIIQWREVRPKYLTCMDFAHREDSLLAAPPMHPFIGYYENLRDLSAVLEMRACDG